VPKSWVTICCWLLSATAHVMNINDWRLSLLRLVRFASLEMHRSIVRRLHCDSSLITHYSGWRIVPFNSRASSLKISLYSFLLLKDDENQSWALSKCSHTMWPWKGPWRSLNKKHLARCPDSEKNRRSRTDGKNQKNQRPQLCTLLGWH
jgi:hypothetical protein